MQNLKWYLADLKSTGKNTIETVEKSLTDMFIRLVRIYPCLLLGIPQSMTGRERYKKKVSSKQFSRLGTLHASRPTAICSDLMAVCSVQIEITESGD